MINATSPDAAHATEARPWLSGDDRRDVTPRVRPTYSHGLPLWPMTERIPREPLPETSNREAGPPIATRLLPGIIVGGVTYESHQLLVISRQYGALKPDKKESQTSYEGEYYVRMAHGAGIENYRADGLLRRLMPTLLAFDDVILYQVLYEYWDAVHTALKIGEETKWNDVAEAFVEGRLKKKKRRGMSSYRVTIEPKPQHEPPTSVASEPDRFRAFIEDCPDCIKNATEHGEGKIAPDDDDGAFAIGCKEHPAGGVGEPDEDLE
jgi:hypothetical protein